MWNELQEASSDLYFFQQTEPQNTVSKHIGISAPQFLIIFLLLFLSCSMDLMPFDYCELAKHISK